MYPPIFAIVSVDEGVQSKLGTSPVRVYPFGEAPDNVELPYAVWQTITGSPENYVSNAPDLDLFVLQIDVYGETGSEVREAAEALRDVIELSAHIVAWRGESRDTESKHFRYSFDVDFFVNR